MGGNVWEVVGGSDNGGILVREERSLSSQQLSERLSTGSLVRELVLHGERLHYEKVKGSGPERGWVSLTLKGRSLLVRKGLENEVFSANTSRKSDVPALQNVRNAVDAIIHKDRETWPLLHCNKLLAWSDLHIDMGENMKHLESIRGDSEAALILCGDVCTKLELLEEALQICKQRFKEVFYVPGNHELWVARVAGRQVTSLEKFVDILNICVRHGVRTQPAFIAPGIAVCPLFSWYKGDFSGAFVPHGGFDVQTFWPEMGSGDAHDPQLPEIANFFLSLNEPRVAEASAARNSGELKTLWTFSHFLPRRELNESGNHAVMLPGVAGDVDLDIQIRSAGSIGHVFGHSHVGQDRVYDGVRYVQQPMGYPTDGHREECPLQLWAEGMLSAGFVSILQSIPPAAAHLDADRVRGAIWGALCADALSMPVCWYYGGQRQIKRDYGGPLTGFTCPRKELAGSAGIMKNEILPRMIDHGRSKHWQPIDSKQPTIGYHYHHGLQSGDITLEGHMLLLFMKATTRSHGRAPDPDRFRQDYVEFMCAGSHGDNWVSRYHRDFFLRLEAGIALEKCADVNEPVETMDALSVQIPIAIASARRSPEEAETEISACIRSLRQCSPTVAKYVAILSGAMRRILSGDNLEDVAEAISSELLPGQGSIASLIQGRKDPMASTSLVECFPSILHYMFRYSESVHDLLLAQANVGGECVHRGAVLGALAGAAHGIRAIPRTWLDGLVQREEIKRDIEAFVAVVC